MNEKKYLNGKFALITGSSRGIGRGIALKLAEKGVTVAVNYLKDETAANDTLTKIKELGSDGFIILHTGLPTLQRLATLITKTIN